MRYVMDEFLQECELLVHFGVKDSALRHEYEEKVRTLQDVTDKLRSEGCSEAEIARTMHEMRRDLGKEYKEAAPPLFREYIYAATAAKYGDPLGPTYDMLKEKKTDAQIIASASRPIKDLNDRLTFDGFKQWYEKGKIL